MSRKRIRALFTFSLLIAGTAVHGGRRSAFAMPFFARRLGAPCLTCHTSPPRLNEVGYQFRAAGYRMPAEIGKSGEKKPFNNDFDRVAFYASYPVAKRLTLLGGVQRGRDDIATGGRFTSLGAYTEAAVPVINDLTNVGVRVDWFDPARNKGRNEVYGITTYMNLWVREQFRFVAEYQRNERRQEPLPNKKDHAFQLRLIFIK